MLVVGAAARQEGTATCSERESADGAATTPPLADSVRLACDAAGKLVSPIIVISWLLPAHPTEPGEIHPITEPLLPGPFFEQYFSESPPTGAFAGALESE
jgi:hypothetical protein